MEQIALPIHITTVFALIALVLYTDKVGLSWMRGTIETIPAKKLTMLHRLVWTGLGIMIASGVTMFIPLQSYLLTVPAFYIKMGFVLVLVINAFAIGRLMHVATERPFAELSAAERWPLFISGTLSTISWIGAITAATFLGL